MNLQDVFIIQNLTVLNEGKTGPLKIRGIFQRADEANNNRRIYPQKVLENQIQSLTEAINERRLVGELDHPTYDMVKLSNASHLITGLRLQGKEVIGEAEILPTPAGKVVEGLIRGGVKIGISSRGMGTLSEGKNGTKTVNEDFRLVTFDIVADPSTRGAYPTLSESRENRKEKQIIESTIKSVVGERYFLKLLEKKINEKLEGDQDVSLPPEIQKQVDDKEKERAARAAKERAAIKARLAARNAAEAQSKASAMGESKSISEGNRQGKPKQGPKHIDKRRPKPKNLVRGGEIVTDPNTGDFQAKPFIMSKRSRAENEAKKRREEKRNKK